MARAACRPLAARRAYRVTTKRLRRQSMSHVLHLFDRAAQLLSAEGGGASSSKLETAGGASSRRRLDFGPSPSLEPPAPSAIEPPSSASSRPSVPRGLKAQPDGRLDHHRAAVLGQRLLAAELRGCERHAALVPELMQLVEEASRVSLSSSLAHAASQPAIVSTPVWMKSILLALLWPHEA